MTNAHTFSPITGSGMRDARGLGDVGMRDEQRLDLLGRDVLAAADDDVLQPVDDREVLAVVHREVAGAEPAAVDERVGVERARRGSRRTSRVRGRAARPARRAATSASVCRVDDAQLGRADQRAVGGGVAFGVVAERGRSSASGTRSSRRCACTSSRTRARLRAPSRAPLPRRRARTCARDAAVGGLERRVVDHRAHEHGRGDHHRDRLALDELERAPRLPRVHQHGRDRARDRAAGCRR